MNRPTWKYLMVCLVVVAALLCGGVQQASAHWHGYYGGWGGWGGCGGYGCGWWPSGGAWWGGCGYGGCGWRGGDCGWGCGGWRGGDCGWGCHRAYRGCGCGDWCGGWPACPVVVSSCCGAPVMGGPVMGAPMMGAPAPGPTPAPPQAPTPAPALPETPSGVITPAPAPAVPPAPAPAVPPVPGAPAPGSRTDALPLGSGQLTIVVPADAKVFINGRQTRTVGTLREYVSYGLEAGLTYRYEVRAEVVRDGKTVVDSREVFLTAGSQENLAFDFAAKKAVSVASL